MGSVAGVVQEDLPDVAAKDAERQVAGIPEERHLEDVYRIAVWDAAYSLRVAAKIPHLPEKSAKEPGGHGGYGC